MRHCRTLLLLLAIAACGRSSPADQGETGIYKAGDDLRANFLKMANGDAWAKWPDGLQENPADNGQPCERVSERFREAAIARLAEASAVAIEAPEYQRLTGTAPPATDGTLYLLRGFSTTNSHARVKVSGSAVTVHSDALGGLFSLRRHPCIARLRNAPSQVYTVAAYDL